MKLLCRVVATSFPQVLQYFEFIGEVDQSRVQDLFVKSDVFVLASRSEGRPNAVIEAVASGLPVICSDLDGVNGLVTHNLNGWIFSVGDSDRSQTSGSAAARKRQESAVS